MRIERKREPVWVRVALSERFRGLFWAQFLGAFSEAFFRRSLLALMVYQGLAGTKTQENAVLELTFLVFTIPYLLFSATAGQLADKLDKGVLIQRIKIFEIVVGFVAAAGVLLESVPLSLTALGLLGVNSALFHPLKYATIPRLVRESDLIEANAAVETGTKLALLLAVTGALLTAGRGIGPHFWCWVLFLSALLGYFVAQMIPPIVSSAPHLQVEWTPFAPTFDAATRARETRPVFLSVLGVAWYGMLGASLWTVVPFYSLSTLQAEPEVTGFLLALVCLGGAFGASLCGKLSLGRLELGLVPFGSLGVSLSLAYLALWCTPVTPRAGQAMDLGQFLSVSHGWHVSISLLSTAVCAGLYIVPLHTFIQQRTSAENLGRVVAACNILTASLALLGVFAFAAFTRKMPDPAVSFSLLALLNFLAGLYIYTLIPEFFLRFLAYLLNHIIYRLKISEQSAIPHVGPALLVGNHVSFIDWLIILGNVQRPVRFVMWHTYYNLPLVKYLFRDAGAIPIASGKTHPEILSAAFESIDRCLAEGELVCIFPEGQLTSDGEVGEFRNGVERILERRPVPVVVFALRGLWDSLFSRQPKRSLNSRLKRLFRPSVTLLFGPRLASPPPGSLHGFAKRLRDEVLELRQNER